MSYEVGGTQYIAVNAGWNSAIIHGLHDGPEPFNVGPANLIVFKLDAKGVTLPPAPPVASIPDPPSEPQPVEQVEAGAVLYSQQCAVCHGQNAVGGVKDLRYLSSERHAEFADIVLGGKLKAQGMVSFSDRLNAQQVQSIHAYLIQRARKTGSRISPSRSANNRSVYPGPGNLGPGPCPSAQRGVRLTAAAGSQFP